MANITQSVSVTAAAGTAGAIFLTTTPSEKVVIVNTSSGPDNDIEYRLGAGAWAKLGRGEGAELSADVSAAYLYFRRVAASGSAPTAEVSITPSASQDSEGGVSSVHRVQSAANPSAGTGAGGGNGYIIDTLRTAQGDFFGVRLVFANYNVADIMQINGAAVAATSYVEQANGSEAAFSTQLVYSGGNNGTTLTWVPVTFNGASSVVVPAAIAAFGNSGNKENLRPGEVVSDFIPLVSIPRADGSPLPLLRTRVHISDNTFPPGVAPSVMQRNNLLSSAPMTGGHIILSGKAAAVVGALTTQSLAPYYYGGAIEPVGVIYALNKRARTICAFGDSLTQGGNSNGQFGWPTRLHGKYGGAPGVAFSAANWGVSGQDLRTSLAVCRDTCSLYKPQYATIFAWSPNNLINGSQAVMDELWGHVLGTIDYLQQIGVTPVVLTSGPVNTMNAVDAVLWRAQNARVMALPASVIKVDVGRALTEPNTYDSTAPKIALPYGTALDGVTYVDGTHYNNAGYEMMADCVYAALI